MTINSTSIDTSRPVEVGSKLCKQNMLKHLKGMLYLQTTTTLRITMLQYKYLLRFILLCFIKTQTKSLAPPFSKVDCPA